MNPTILEQLSRNGFKQTNVRTVMVELFTDSKNPISVEEILKFLKRKEMLPNKTTVYREINFLRDQNVVREVELGDGKKRYELAGTEHHHHLVCMNCRAISCVDMDRDVEELEKRFPGVLTSGLKDIYLNFSAYAQNADNIFSVIPD